MKAIVDRKILVKGKCKTAFCKHPTDSGYCSTCRSRIWRQNNKEKYWYNNHKNRAIQRGIPHDLTFEQFLAYGHKTKYFSGKNRSAEGLTIGRINEDPLAGYHGYRIDNLMPKPQTLVDNIKKYFLQYDWEHKLATVWKPQNENDMTKETVLLQKFLGYVGRARKYQKNYFKTKMQYDKNEAIKYERKVDEYIKLLLKNGYNPIFDEDTQVKMFPPNDLRA